MELCISSVESILGEELYEHRIGDLFIHGRRSVCNVHYFMLLCPCYAPPSVSILSLSVPFLSNYHTLILASSGLASFLHPQSLATHPFICK
jgi:hypothetical protein